MTLLDENKVVPEDFILKYQDFLVIDCANGVGAIAIQEMKDQIEQFLKIKLINFDIYDSD